MATINGGQSGPNDNSAPGAAAMDFAENNAENNAENVTQSTSTTSIQGASFATVTAKGENCTGMIYDFCRNVLKIENPESSIRIDRAHRIGNRAIGKTRPIVAMLVGSRDKEMIKQASRDVDLR